MTIEIYLIRHGLAGQFGDYDEDALRPLTPEGLKKTQKVAQRLKALGIQFDLVLTSPYTRALQTAIVLQSTGLVETLETLEQLQPDGEISIVITHVASLRKTVSRIAIVGHEPDLTHLASQLIFGQDCENLTLKKAGVIGLTAPIEGELMGQCQLFWLVPPRLLLG
jgi:phosphohistidine phosphatase